MSVINPSLIDVRDEGTSQGRVTALNFSGAGVTASVSGFVGTVTIPGGGGGGATATRVVANFPFPAKHTQFVTITDATVSATSKIIAWASGLADSDLNSSMEDAMVIQAFAGTGDFLLTINSKTPIGGGMSIDYMVLA